MSNPKVFFDMTVDGKPVDRIVMELFADTTPRTTENFWALCTGEKGIGKSGKPLHYKGSCIHHVSIKNRDPISTKEEAEDSNLAKEKKGFSVSDNKKTKQEPKMPLSENRPKSNNITSVWKPKSPTEQTKPSKLEPNNKKTKQEPKMPLSENRPESNNITSVWKPKSPTEQTKPSKLEPRDIIVGDGSGGESIYGGTFEDENYIKQHTGPGILSMSNGGPDSNNSQFMICMKKCFGLDDVHVVFGQVVEGLDVFKSIMEEVQTYSGKLSKPW
ncbi:predicted protein [Arabidopsis lyrata subsp. lyrata]|uniref:Predicted protein n=1 Tax=Arabidopsis lyrata subsp. lyrata TaxID=81972 RepID=D7L443_ARALL|nr:predicted protein [Arabidopsis lyrata subsp. lyrata]